MSWTFSWFLVKNVLNLHVSTFLMQKLLFDQHGEDVSSGFSKKKKPQSAINSFVENTRKELENVRVTFSS